MAKLTEHQQKIREGWRYRAIAHARGNQSRLGCIVLAMLNKSPDNPPRISILDDVTPVIRADGMVLANMELRNGRGMRATPLGHISEVVDNMRWLADTLKLSDAERTEMFDVLRKWIKKDFRATSDPELMPKPKTVH